VAQMPPEMQPPASTPALKMITISVFVLVEGAEAEGFEPPVPLGTLAFKVVDPAISSDHHSTMGRSSTMHGHPWVLPITGECNHKCNHCGTPLGRPSPAGMQTDEGL
jgi:hypothetical protein